MPHSQDKRIVNPTSIAVVVATAVGLLLLPAIGLYRVALGPVSHDTRVHLVTLPAGGSQPVADLLKRQGLIRSAAAFRMLEQTERALDKNRTPKPGYYDLSPSMSSEEILARLCAGQFAKRRVTFPEGFTLVQMAGRLETEVQVPHQDFVDAAQGSRVSRALDFKLPSGELEGYLFPNTYTFDVGEKPELIVSQMVATFNEMVVKPSLAEIKQAKLSLPELVTIASLVEREARVDKDRPLIAGVIMNRLAKKMRLQIDATVQYALPEHKSRLSRKDLWVDSPYNTYRHAGLPPGPICNPGLASFLAALRPAQSDYLFYVAKPDGSHIFTKTYEDHKKAIEGLKKGRGAAGKRGSG
jgi:UPF0755 protein